METLLPSCTEQLWSMTPPFDAPWTHGDNEDSRAKEMEAKNIELNRSLGLLLLQIHIAREDLERVRAERAELQERLEAEMRESRELLSELRDKGRELQDLRVELALLRSEREELKEQELLAVEIWGPSNRRQPDATWDPPAVLLFHQPKPASDAPLSIGKVASDLGFKHGAQQLHHLGAHVREAFMRAHGKAPEPRVFFDKNGTPDRIGCFTERDREFLEAVVRRYGEPDID